MYVFSHRSHPTNTLSVAISRFLLAGPVAVLSLNTGRHSMPNNAPACAIAASTDMVRYVRYQYVFSKRMIEQRNEEAPLKDAGSLLVNMTLQIEFYSRYSRADRTQDIEAERLSINSFLHSLSAEQRKGVLAGLRREVDLVESMTDEELQEQAHYHYLPSHKQSILAVLHHWIQRFA